MQHLLQAVNASTRPRIAVLGDLILDHYITGDVSRISPEAPIPVLAVQREEYKLGGAANVAANAVALGAHAHLIGVVANDGPGRELRALVRGAQGMTMDAVVASDRPTIVKTRLVARHQQMMRVDAERTGAMPASAYRELKARLARALKDAGLLILSDYGKGALNEALTREAIALARKAGVPVLVDPKGRDYSRYAGATAITPNRKEAEAATGMACDSDTEVRRCAGYLRTQLKLDAVLITLGEGGVALLCAESEHALPASVTKAVRERPARSGSRALRFVRIPTVARSVFDVTGAGDTFIATLGVFLAQGVGFEDAARLANAAAGIKVGRFGAAAVSRDELRRAIYAAHEAFDYHAKIVSRADAKAISESLRRAGRRIVFTNGCFDILHAGHVTYLHFCKSRGDVLMLGLNTDESVRKRKGPSRPINVLEDRARVLAALADVDFVVPFGSERELESLIRAVRPAVLVKGEDWKGKTVAGGRFVESIGGRVEFARLLEGRSTTSTIERLVRE